MLRTEELPLADQHLRRGVEPVVLEADERAPEEREPVEHEPPGEDRARLAREALVATELELLVRPPERAAEAEPLAGTLQDREIEVADVPAREHVGVDGADVREKRVEQGALVRDDVGARDRPPSDEEHALAARARHRERVETLPVDARLQVEREDAERGREGRRLERRVSIHAADAGPALERPVDREGAADAAIDEVPVCEADVGLEAVDAPSASRLRTAGTSPGAPARRARPARRRRS
jgi:hypothetical protein